VPAATPPHPAVARIVVPEKDGISYGSGTLVDVRGGFGLVVTNWHVVRDAAGPITAEFQDGFKSPAEVVKTDKDWDLAALSVYSPKADPVPVTAVAPQPGEWLTIAGYGSGDWRTASGPCTQYLAPGVEFPHEMVELATEARQGDSGGPIFNQRGELAGVLFGSGPGYTSGSYGGRVLKFLSAVVPGGVPGVDLSAAASAVAAATPRPDADSAAQKLGLPTPPQATALHEARPPANALPSESDLLAPAPPPSEDRLLVPPPRSDFADRFGPGPGLANEEVDPKAAVRPDRLAAALPPSRMSPLESAPLSGVPAVVHTPLPPRIGTGAAANGAAGAGGVLTDLNQAPTEQLLAMAWRRVGGTTFTDQAKTIFAFIGALSVVVLLWRASSSRERMADDD
jgi:hypothetical protein